LWFTGLGLAAGGVGGGGGLAAVVGLGEGEAERHIRQRVPVVVDVEPVDRIGVEPVAVGEGVRVHDQHGPVGVIGRREHKQIGQVQTGIVAGVLEVGGAEVVRHRHSFGGRRLGGGAAAGYQLHRKPSSAVFTWSDLRLDTGGPLDAAARRAPAQVLQQRRLPTPGSPTVVMAPPASSVALRRRGVFIASGRFRYRVASVLSYLLAVLRARMGERRLDPETAPR
jgi:hypothetical protein